MIVLCIKEEKLILGLLTCNIMCSG